MGKEITKAKPTKLARIPEPERSQQLPVSALDQRLADARKLAEIAKLEEQTALSRLTARGMRPYDVHELNNEPEFSFEEGPHQLEKW